MAEKQLQNTSVFILDVSADNFLKLVTLSVTSYKITVCSDINRAIVTQSITPVDNLYQVGHVTMKGLVALTCIVHDINVSPQLRASKVVAVLNRVIESRQQDE